MSKGRNSDGLILSASLVRYFDAGNRNAIRANPRIIFATGVLFGIGVLILNSLAF